MFHFLHEDNKQKGDNKREIWKFGCNNQSFRVLEL